METTKIESILEFLQSAEQLKDTLRNSITSKGRQESTAEHTWRLCLMVMLFQSELGDTNVLHLLKLCIIHDLGEAISGDIPAIEQQDDIDKSVLERKDIRTLTSSLPNLQKTEILALWEEYEKGETREARLAKGFDKLETIMQHNIGKNAVDFDHQFNLSYGKPYTDKHPLLKQIRLLVDQATNTQIKKR